jgi:16S rRNA (guanine527-N7)-methyltransferase
VKPDPAALEKLGIQPSVEVVAALERLADWLATEGIAGGGLGPGEAEVIWQRHLLDSAVYSIGWPKGPRECWDLGSGVGLPGLVLAILWPHTRVLLIDRSGRRCDLARRAARVTGVEVDVRKAEIAELVGQVEAIVSRAAIPADRLRPVLERLLAPGGRAVISGGGTPVDGFEHLEVPPGVLDRPSRLLMMRAS